MAITGQQAGWLWARNFSGQNVHTVTVRVTNRDTFADIALYDGWVEDDEWHVTKCGIVQIVSDSGVENWNLEQIGTHNPVAFRRNVTSVTFGVLGYNAEAGARWMLDFWS
jgi:hypothetical protein